MKIRKIKIEDKIHKVDKRSKDKSISEKVITWILCSFLIVSILAVQTNTVFAAKKSKDSIIIGIDPGHQKQGDSSLEAVGPGSSTKKAKVSSGTSGVSTKVPEYKLTLAIAKKVKKELKNRGYQVVMTRESNHVKISNKQRAKKINKSGADICIRLHADGIDSSSVTGASALYPSKENKYVSKLSKKSLKLAESILDTYCETTGIKNRGCVKRDDLTGTNWSKVPVIVLEMGFMSNPTEDKKMQQKKFQKKMVQGICYGIDTYYK